ncbi:efflux transporter outer membrane subunit [Flavobacterium sp.]|jgi:multidrug efflux system outer membrane protein|uniref:efflux transporter outer membrane subunit n=1 Tax=Flavobacterium sp. TaxID=239 RepID=UPI0037C17911
MSKHLRILTVLLIAVLLPIGCKVGPKYSRPQIENNPQSYSNQAADANVNDSVANVKWFDIFDDPVLKDLIQKGLDNNYDVRIALARIEQSKAVLGITKADLLPNIGYVGQVNSKQSFEFPSSLGANLSWELDFWGKIRHETGALRSELLASDEARKVVVASLVSEIATTYFQLRDFDNRLTITQKTIESRKKSDEIIGQRFEKGYVSQLDKVQVEQQVAIAEGTLQQVLRTITVLENSLNILTGQMPDPIARGKWNFEQTVNTQIPVALPSTLLENRPDVKRSELQYIAANERIGVAQAMRFPSFNIAAFAGFASPEISKLFDSGSYIQNVGGGVFGPLFNFGKNKQRVVLNKQKAEESKLNYQRSVLNAVAEVENALVGVETYNEEWKAATRQTEAARTYLKLSQARYDSGYVSYLEVLDAERSLFDSELNLSRLSQEKLSAVMQLYKALGGGW